MKITKINQISQRIKNKKTRRIVHSRVWRNSCFKSWIDLSSPSKVQAFLSLQIPHMRQREIMAQIAVALCLLNLCDQLAKRSTTPLGITHCTTNKENTKFHNSLAIRQCISKRSMVSPYLIIIIHFFFISELFSGYLFY